MTPPRVLAIVALLVLAPSARADAVRLYSYDPADPETRIAAGSLTFEFRQGLFHTTMMSVRATEAQATAELQPVRESDLNVTGLTPLIGATATERDVYSIKSDREGAAMIAAFCPGSEKAWMAFGRPRLNRDLRVYVVGPSATGGVRLCRTLNFSFHGDWRLPPVRKVPDAITAGTPLRRF